MSDDPELDDIIKAEIADLRAATAALAAKARQLVELMDDAERNHGSLIGGKTLTAVNELRLELSKWQK